MKCFLFICLLPLALLPSAETGANDSPCAADTLKVHSTGQFNRVQVDTLHITSANDSTVVPFAGEITQEGENNSVELNSGNQLPNDKSSQMTNDKSPATNDEKQNNDSKSRITIKQTGKNNSAIINTP